MEWNIYDIVNTTDQFNVELRNDLNEFNFKSIYSEIDVPLPQQSPLIAGFNQPTSQKAGIRTLGGLLGSVLASIRAKTYQSSLQNLISDINHTNLVSFMNMTQTQDTMAQYTYYPIQINTSPMFGNVLYTGGVGEPLDKNPFSSVGNPKWDDTDDQDDQALITSGVNGMTKNLNNLVSYLTTKAINDVNNLSKNDTANKALIGEITNQIMELPTEVIGSVPPTNFKDFEALQLHYKDTISSIEDWYKNKVSDALTIYDATAKNFNNSIPKEDKGIPANNPKPMNNNNIDHPDTVNPDINSGVNPDLEPDATGRTEFSAALLDTRIFGMPVYIGVPVIAGLSYYIFREL